MEGFDEDAFKTIEFSVAMTAEVDEQLADHLYKTDRQEDMTFAFWRPSRGSDRYTAIVNDIPWPSEDERLLQGNVAFTPEYLGRVLESCPSGSGIALIHSHLGPGWQGMSADDIIAERDRLAGVVAGRTGLPLLGMTWGTDGTWSARFWLRVARHQYERRWATTVRTVGRRLRLSYHPELRPAPRETEAQVATRSVWGDKAQAELARVHVGVIGLGSVGSIVAEGLSRTGVERITLIDHDRIEERNLDRTLGALPSDVEAATPKNRGLASAHRAVAHLCPVRRHSARRVSRQRGRARASPRLRRSHLLR